MLVNKSLIFIFSPFSLDFQLLMFSSYSNFTTRTVDSPTPPPIQTENSQSVGQVRAAFEQAERHFLVMVDDGVFTDPVEGGHEVGGLPL